MENILLSIGIALAVGLIMSRVVKMLKLPAVTGYLVGGILIGPYCLGRLGINGIGFATMEQVNSLKVLSEISLGFIAFSIGNEFRISQLKKTGKQALIIGIFQALAATLVVDVGLFLLHLALGDKLPLPAVIVLGAIATATAPAATLMVVHQYKAKGKLTDILLPVVAIDDAVGLVIFAISFGIAKVIASGTYDVMLILLEPILEIIISILIGAIVGTILTFAEKFFKSRSKRMSVVVTSVILSVAISMFQIKLRRFNNYYFFTFIMYDVRNYFL